MVLKEGRGTAGWVRREAQKAIEYYALRRLPCQRWGVRVVGRVREWPLLPSRFPLIFLPLSLPLPPTRIPP